MEEVTSSVSEEIGCEELLLSSRHFLALLTDPRRSFALLKAENSRFLPFEQDFWCLVKALSCWNPHPQVHEKAGWFIESE
jgi:hypothetical protein